MITYNLRTLPPAGAYISNRRELTITTGPMAGVYEEVLTPPHQDAPPPTGRRRLHNDEVPSAAPYPYYSDYDLQPAPYVNRQVYLPTTAGRHSPVPARYPPERSTVYDPIKPYQHSTSNSNKIHYQPESDEPHPAPTTAPRQQSSTHRDQHTESKTSRKRRRKPRRRPQSSWSPRPTRELFAQDTSRTAPGRLTPVNFDDEEDVSTPVRRSSKASTSPKTIRPSRERANLAPFTQQPRPPSTDVHHYNHQSRHETLDEPQTRKRYPTVALYQPARDPIVDGVVVGRDWSTGCALPGVRRGKHMKNFMKAKMDAHNDDRWV